MKYDYKISLKNIGVLNPRGKAASVIPVITFKGVYKTDEASSVVNLDPGKGDQWDFDFELESGEPPLLKTSELGPLYSGGNYIVESDDQNKIVGQFYGLQDAPAVLGGQNIIVGDFTLITTPFAVRAVGVPLSRCYVPVTIRCKDETQILMLKDTYRVDWWNPAQGLSTAATLGPDCSTDEDNACEKSLDICGGNVRIKIIRTDLKCKSVRNVRIETISRMSDDERKRYNKMGETFTIAFWKAGSKCWENGLNIQPGCEDDFYGAFDVLIPADKYVKEGTAPPQA
jgi:hypothetical protein